MVRPPDDLFPDTTRWRDLLFLSGRAALDPATGDVRATTFGEQLRIVLDDAHRVLAQAGASLGDVLRVECWLTDRAQFAEWNAAFADAFPHPRPARSTFVVAGLPIPGLLVELQLTAAVPA
jgi:2-iminobutanoate/2-iminopropanoate deaminase